MLVLGRVYGTFFSKGHKGEMSSDSMHFFEGKKPLENEFPSAEWAPQMVVVFFS